MKLVLISPVCLLEEALLWGNLLKCVFSEHPQRQESDRSLEAEIAVTDSLETDLRKDTKSGAVVPVIDVGEYFAGVDGAEEKLMPVLCQTLTNVGFFSLIGHGVRREVIDGCLPMPRVSTLCHESTS